MYECKYCKAQFTRSSTLNTHLKTAKYCLTSRSPDLDIIGFECASCGKRYASKSYLQQHYVGCSSHPGVIYQTKLNLDLKKLNDDLVSELMHKNEMLLQLGNTVGDLRNELHNLVVKAIERPNTSTTNIANHNNNLTINMAVFDKEIIQDKLDRGFKHDFTHGSLLEGMSAVARVAASAIRDEEGAIMMTCTDPSRHVWKLKDSEGNIKKDPKASKLAEIVEPKAILKSDSIVLSMEEKLETIKKIRQNKRRMMELSKKDEEDHKELRALPTNSYQYNIIDERMNERYKNNVKMKKELEELIVVANIRGYDIDYPVEVLEDQLAEVKEARSNLIGFSKDSGKFSLELHTAVTRS